MIQMISSTLLSTCTSAKPTTCLDRIRIVGDAAHQLPRFVAGIEAERKPVEMRKQAHAQDAQHVLAGPTHAEEHQAASDRPGQIEGGDDQRQIEQAAQQLIAAGIPRSDFGRPPAVGPAVAVGLQVDSCGQLDSSARIGAVAKD